MKRGVQGVTRREQPKLPITKSVARDTIWGYLRFIQKYNLYFSEILWGLIGENDAFTENDVFWSTVEVRKKNVNVRSCWRPQWVEATPSQGWLLGIGL